MPKQLYYGKAWVDIYVVAESQEEARQLMRRHLSDEISNQDAGIDVEEASMVESCWYGCLPYGAHDDKPVEVWLKEKIAMQRHHAQDLRQGLRIELHPATDRWMMGDRFGVIQSVNNEWIRVKLDRSGKIMRFHVDNILHLDSDCYEEG